MRDMPIVNRLDRSAGCNIRADRCQAGSDSVARVAEPVKAREGSSDSRSRGGRLPPVEQRVFDDIVRAIYEQRLRPGTKLGEEALAAAFSVSRARIRRVLLALSHQRLVDLIPNRGAFVIRPTEDDARDIFSARQVLENLVVERVAARPEPAVIGKLRAHVQSEAAARDKGQRREAIRMSGEFHTTLARLSGSRVFQGTLEPVLLQSSLIVSMYGGGVMASCSVEEHQAIVDALEQGDAAKASELMREHLAHLEGTLRLEVEHDEEPDFAAIFR